MMNPDRIDTFIRGLGLYAYRVGGSVRDEILGRKPKDCDYVIFGADLATVFARLMARKHECERFNVVPLVLRDGRQSGWRFSARGLGCVEISLPRVERSTGPGHRDFEIIVDPTLSIEDDAIRRDFTFNAVYYGPFEGDSMATIRDPLHGINDMLGKRVNVTHRDSFRDDPPRILRALRFVSTLDYDLGPETHYMMHEHAEAVTGLTLKGVSGTVLDELCKLLMGQAPARALRLMAATGVMAIAFPELAPMIGYNQGSRYHDLTTDEHTFKAIETAAHVEAPLRVRMALLFHDAGKPETAWVGKDGRKHYYAAEIPNPVWNTLGGPHVGENETVPPRQIVTEDHEVVGERIWRRAAERLQASKALREDVATLIRNHMVKCEKVNPVKVRRERVRLGDDLLRDLYLLRMCDLTGKGEANRRYLANVAQMEKERENAQAAGVPSTVKDLKITGYDTGLHGPEVGRILRTVLDEVVVDPSEQKQTWVWQSNRARALAREAT